MTISRNLAPRLRTVDVGDAQVEHAAFLHFGAERSSIGQRRREVPEEFKA